MMTLAEMFFKVFIICLALNYAFGTEALQGNETQIDLRHPLDCSANNESLEFFESNNVSYGYGLLADCSAFFFNTRNADSWKELKTRLNAQSIENYKCYGNDFIVDLQFDQAGAPIMFIIDKTYLLFTRVIMPHHQFDDRVFYEFKTDMDAMEKGLPHGWMRRGEESFYNISTYGHAGSVTGKAISMIWQTNSKFRVNVGVRGKKLEVDYRCIFESEKKAKFPPILINYIPSGDWRTAALNTYYTRKYDLTGPDLYLEHIKYLWIICISVTIFAVFVAIVTGIIMNRARKSQVKLEVAVEALLASSCTNPQHQLRRSALLTTCGFPSVELNDTNITTAGPLQDDTNGMQTINEYDVLAEQIRRVQAAPVPEKSEKSGSQSTQSSKK